MLNELIKDLQKLADKEKAQIYSKFFKTGRGEYGEGDIFIGLTVPQQRAIAKKYMNLSLPKIKQILRSRVHEHRFTGLVILTEKYKKGTEQDRANIFDFYLNSTKYINNWDLVDVTCSRIVGDFLLNKDKKILYNLAKSKNLWERRIAIVSTLNFVSNGEINDALALSEILLLDKHDLIHKAVGWVLREVGKKDEKALLKFIEQHYKDIPRTTLRYAIEKFPEEKRKKILGGELR